MPSVLQEFSRELRRHSVRRGSIAQLCKATGINRQQFNKYLAGQIIPSARNLRKICAYLHVTEAELMSHVTPAAASAQPSSVHDDTAIDLSQLSGLLAKQLDPGNIDQVTEANVLPCGYYDCYVPLHEAPDNLVRWLLKVDQAGDGLTFTSRTYVRDMRGAVKPATRNKYHGVGIAGPREAYLIGTSRMQSHQPGILAINQSPALGSSYFTGLAITPRHGGAVAIAAALHYRGTAARARDLLAALGLINQADPTLDPVIARIMGARPAPAANWVQSVSGKSLRPATLNGGSEVNLPDHDRLFSA